MTDAGADVEDIRDLLTRYGSYLDRGLVDQWLALFAEPSVLELRGDPLDTEERRRHLAETAPRGLHLCNLPLIAFEAGRARSTQTFVFWNPGNGSAMAGWYDDQVQRIDGRWMFRRRVITMVGSDMAPGPT